jgi:nucleoside-diphosphate-sugar epimerase
MSVVAVTGCQGYVGGHLVERLRADGHEVVGIDHRAPNGVSVTRFVQVEIADPGSVGVCREALRGCAAVFHLASHQPFSWDLHPFVRGNVMRTAHLLEAMRQEGVRRLIHSSTVAVYGRPNTLPLRETTPLRPENPYEVTKAQAEALAGLYADKGGIAVTVLRYPSIFGGRARFGAIHTFVDATLKGVPIRLFARGTARRDLVHVFDVVAANLLTLRHRQEPALATYNIASGQAPMSRELCELIFDVVGRKTAIELAEDPNWRPQDLVVDITKARSDLNFAPRTLREGIAELAASLRAEHAK